VRRDLRLRGRFFQRGNQRLGHAHGGNVLT
jgi:hypothetical protein